MVCEHVDMNISPPPNYRACYGPVDPDLNGNSSLRHRSSSEIVPLIARSYRKFVMA